MSKNNLKLRSNNRIPGRDVRIANSSERMINNQGQINASNTADLLNHIYQLAQMVSSGEVDISDARNDNNKDDISIRNEILMSAYASDRASGEWENLGAAISAELSEVADREGFMRKIIERVPVSDGQIPRIRVKTKNVTAIVAASATTNMAQRIQDKYLYPDEWYIQTDLLIEKKELVRGTGDILQDKFFEAQEAIMVREDRKLISLVNDAIGIANNLQILAGGLTPSTLSALSTQVARWGITPEVLLFATNILDDIRGNTQFHTAMDPVSQYEIITTGIIGSIYGMNVMTDAYRHPQLKVLNAGEIFVFGKPDLTGAYTDRGPVESQEKTGYNNGDPSRGWHFNELISILIHNTRAVAKGIKQ